MDSPEVYMNSNRDDEEMERDIQEFMSVILEEEDEQEVFWPTAFARIDPQTVDVKYSFYDGSTGIATSLIELYLLLTGHYRIHRLADDPFPESR